MEAQVISGQSTNKVIAIVIAALMAHALAKGRYEAFVMGAGIITMYFGALRILQTTSKAEKNTGVVYFLVGACVMMSPVLLVFIR